MLKSNFLSKMQKIISIAFFISLLFILRAEAVDIPDLKLNIDIPENATHDFFPAEQILNGTRVKNVSIVIKGRGEKSVMDVVYYLSITRLSNANKLLADIVKATADTYTRGHGGVKITKDTSISTEGWFFIDERTGVRTTMRFIKISNDEHWLIEETVYTDKETSNTKNEILNIFRSMRWQQGS